MDTSHLGQGPKVEHELDESPPEHFGNEDVSGHEWRSLGRYLSPEEIEEARRRRDYAKQVQLVRKAINRRKHSFKHEGISIRSIQKALGIKGNALVKALSPRCITNDTMRLSALFEAMHYLGMSPKAEWMDEQFDPYRKWGNDRL